MSKFIETFGNQPVLLPVIHVVSEKQALENAQILSQENVRGSFLISMDGMPNSKLLEIHSRVKSEYPKLWLGINLLTTSVKRVFEKIDNRVDGVWTDNAMIHEGSQAQKDAQEIVEARIKSGWDGLYFGGIAFKGQRKVDNPASVAMIAGEYMDVVTTSGERTGKPPEIAKISDMKNAIGNTPLGIASGISIDNISDYIGIADCFLVASSMLQPGTDNFDRGKVRDLQGFFILR